MFGRTESEHGFLPPGQSTHTLTGRLSASPVCEFVHHMLLPGLRTNYRTIYRPRGGFIHQKR